MQEFDKFLVQEPNEVCQSQFFKKYELDEDGEKAFPMPKGRGQQVSGASYTDFHSLLSSEFYIICPLNISAVSLIAYDLVIPFFNWAC